MWEITLIGKMEDYGYFSQLKDSILKLKLNTYISVSVGEKLYISIASYSDISSDIDDLIYEAIIKINKRDFMINHLDFINNNGVLDDFILSSIIYMDLPKEIRIAKYYAKLGKTNDVRSFFRFKLHQFLDIWQSITQELNLSINSSKKESIYLDFLKFLADVTEPKFDIIYLNKDSNKIQLLDINQNSIKSLSLKDEIDIIVNLIMYSPKKIVIHKSNLFSKNIYNMIDYIFRDRVSLVL